MKEILKWVAITLVLVIALSQVLTGPRMAPIGRALMTASPCYLCAAVSEQEKVRPTD